MMLRLLIFLFGICFVLGEEVYLYETKHVEVPVDHFSFSTNHSFQLRYLVNSTYWKKNGGPIFFYTGNEGDIELFAQNTGFMWEIAPEFEALVVFAEHRYYGSSMPFGNKSFSAPQYLGYLTSYQALADYVDLITILKKTDGASNNPVVAFGGSYGGMLAAYIRMKYPHIVIGSIAASAPLLQFTGLTPCDAFSRILTSVYKLPNDSCASLIKKSWNVINSIASTDEGRSWISSQWKLCHSLGKNDVKPLKDWLVNVLTNLAMINYPYATSFLMPVPANPVKAFCKYLTNSTLDGKELLVYLQKGFNIYTNYTGKTKCIDFKQDASPQLGDQGWDFQSCTEMVMPICSTGQYDMFETSPWDLISLAKTCNEKWKQQPQPFLALKEYGGKDISSATNIVFSNGMLDPWSSGGIMRNMSRSVVAIIIPEGAHHLDLRATNLNDPISAIIVRKFHKYNIRTWIRQYRTMIKNKK